jgi:hypothetical protein
MHRTYLDCKESQLAKDTTSHYPACHGYAGRLILCSCLQARPPVSKKKGYDIMVLFGSMPFTILTVAQYLLPCGWWRRWWQRVYGPLPP